jgi:hypothetical protein
MRVEVIQFRSLDLAVLTLGFMEIMAVVHEWSSKCILKMEIDFNIEIILEKIENSYLLRFYSNLTCSSCDSFVINLPMQ